MAFSSSKGPMKETPAALLCRPSYLNESLLKNPLKLWRRVPGELGAAKTGTKDVDHDPGPGYRRQQAPMSDENNVDELR